MAKNYSIAEAVQIITENEDTSSITELGKRFPLLSNKIARIAVLAGNDFVDFMNYFPEHISANKINKAIKEAGEGTEEADDDADDEEVEEAEAPKPKKSAGRPKKVKEVEPEDDEEDEESDGDTDYDKMSNKELWNLLGEVGGRKKCRAEFGDTKTPDMIKFFKKYYPNGVDAEQPEEAEEAEEESKYAGKSAVELYKICKTRKIKVEQKKPTKYYIDILEKADAEAEAPKKKPAKKVEKPAKEADDDAEWDDDEEEEAPKKSTKKAEKKPAKKAEPEEADDDEDDDEWEI